MTPYDAIIAIKLLKAEIEWDLSLEYQEALDEAIRALKKQVPEIITSPIAGGYAICPVCGRKCENSHDYCPWCGQRIER